VADPVSTFAKAHEENKKLKSEGYEVVYENEELVTAE
jgi:hypothetical protein